MIVDTLENCGQYYGLHPRMEAAFRFLNECLSEPKAPGRYEIDGENLYVLLSEYAPKAKDHPRYEAHDRYLDIQCMLSGSENQWYAPRKTQKTETEYNPVKDIEFFAFHGNGSELHLAEKSFAVYFPQDGHLPSMPDGVAEKCVRAVVKLKIEL